MGRFADMWEENERRKLAVLTPCLVEGETLLAALYGNRPKAVGTTTFLIGVTNWRLILVEMKKDMTPKGTAVTIAPHQITHSAVWGRGGGAMDFLNSNAHEQIKFDTADEKYKFYIDRAHWLTRHLPGAPESRAVDPLIQFLEAAKAARGG